MASSSGTSSGSSSMIHQNSGSEEDLTALMDQRKRKRMISNRESARRSRMRKQKHLDDLTGQISQLKKDNEQIISSLNITSQHYMNVEAENSVLRAQADELSNRLQSLNEIASFLNANNGGVHAAAADSSCFTEPHDSFFNPLNLSYLNQPITASAEMFY
ncbi:LOW QUALITY PROTEIN: bZIP transcription factor 11 [Pyrus x bretschneideri]|uniref:LOW QUALITY PROTEIN: bZIP transcription factor 11 n=1 Tax=Pyrus x bretschneideri TaxID=225117 RepID=UPI000511A448|nr:LOW QUALITY PROTEIN: bZIP transcription factor 11 [Pyrus x bretschneideri]